MLKKKKRPCELISRQQQLYEQRKKVNLSFQLWLNLSSQENFPLKYYFIFYKTNAVTKFVLIVILPDIRLRHS